MKQIDSYVQVEGPKVATILVSGTSAAYGELVTPASTVWNSGLKDRRLSADADLLSPTDMVLDTLKLKWIPAHYWFTGSVLQKFKGARKVQWLQLETNSDDCVNNFLIYLHSFMTLQAQKYQAASQSITSNQSLILGILHHYFAIIFYHSIISFFLQSSKYSAYSYIFYSLPKTFISWRLFPRSGSFWDFS